MTQAIACMVPTFWNDPANGATWYLVETPSGVIYYVGISTTNLDVHFMKSTNGGLSWGPATSLRNGTHDSVAIWYDRWSGINGGLIHVAMCETGTDDVMYRSIDTENADALSTVTTIYNGTSIITSTCFSITRARGGNLYVKFINSAGTEGGFFRSTDVGANWASRTDSEALAASDSCILLPGWAADNQDVMGIFYDNSASEISRILYDDSADSWTEASIQTGVTIIFSNAQPGFSAAVDLANSRNVVLVWTSQDVANADLMCWTVTESAITAKADVVTNSVDDQGMCGLIIDQQGVWRALYGGKSDGSETFNSAITLNHKVSADQGASWGPETPISFSGEPRGFRNIRPAPISYLALVFATGVLSVNVWYGALVRMFTRAPSARSSLGVI